MMNKLIVNIYTYSYVYWVMYTKVMIFTLISLNKVRLKLRIP